MKVERYKRIKYYYCYYIYFICFGFFFSKAMATICGSFLCVSSSVGANEREIGTISLLRAREVDVKVK